MSNSNILRGTMLLTGATFFSKFLGMLYVIPFFALVGSEGGALFQYGYTPYNIMLTISTVGLPLAISKFVSKYNSLGDYQTGRRMYRSAMIFMSITGFLSFLILYLGAETIAHWILPVDEIPEGATLADSVEDITIVIQMVSFALLLIPGMSLTRGFFQGYESMGPTAISQVVEQIVRILFLLSAAFLVVKVFEGSIATAVSFATFAAFVGAIASCIVLWFYWKKRKSHLDKQLALQTTTHDLSNWEMFKELFSYAGAFVLVGMATPLYQFVDLVTFKRAMIGINQGDISDIAYAAITLYGHKLVIIPVTLATGLSLAVLPALTKSFVSDVKNEVYQQINQAFQVILLLVVPAAIGIALLSYEAYGTLYSLENIDLTGMLLRWYAPVAILYAFFVVSASVLQGINQQRFAVVSLGIGFAVKALSNIPLITFLGPKGSVIATGLAVLSAVIANFWRIKYTIDFPFKQLFKRGALVAMFTIAMALVVLVLKWGLNVSFALSDSRMGSLLVLVLCSIVGAIMYLWLAYKSSLLERVLGNRVKKIERIFRRG